MWLLHTLLHYGYESFRQPSVFRRPAEHGASYFLFGFFNTLSAPIRAKPNTTLERVNTAFGQIVSAAF